MIQLNLTPSTSSTATFRLRVGGVDASGSNYVSQTLSISAAVLNNIVGGTFTNFQLSTTGLITKLVHNYEINKPFNAEPTVTKSYGIQRNGTAIMVFGSHDLSTSYDGFSLIISAGTMTGSVSVYGYNK